MDILQIGDIVRISDSVAEDPLEDWSFVIYNRHVNTSKRIANAGQFGCVTGLIRIGLTDDIYVFVVPCQKDFDFLQDRHALRHVEGFFIAQSQVELVCMSSLRTHKIPVNIGGSLVGLSVPSIASPVPDGVLLYGGSTTPKGCHVSQVGDHVDTIDIEVDSEDGYVGSWRIPYTLLKPSFTTF